MHTIPLYFHHMLTLGDRFDRPDAPDNSAPDFTPQIVYKLFIEIPSASPAPGAPEPPFTTLANAAQRWALEQFPGIAATPQSLLSLLTLEHLVSFLWAPADPFEFQILPASRISSSNPPALAPFPMLPFLTLTPPAPAAPVEFGTRKPCSAGYLANLADPFAVPKGRPEPASTSPGVTQPFPSLAAGMFTDYFVTVIRHLMDQSDPASAAKAASLFLMHSIRLPDPEAPGASDYPLYVLSGQQAPLVPDKGKEQAKQYDHFAGHTVRLAASTGAKVQVTFPENGGAFTFSALPAQIATLLDSAPLAAPFIPGDRILALAQSEPFAVAPMRFALSDPVVWKPAHRIYALPQSLRDQLTQSPFPPADDLDLSLILRGASTPPPHSPPAHSWGTRVTFTIRQVADLNAAGQFLPTIYEIAGMDTDSRDDLLSFLISPEASAGLFQASLLYAANPSVPAQGMKSDSDEFWLVKSNFSTEAHTVGDSASASAVLPMPGAEAGKAREFLKLLWEASLVSSGGFYLFHGPGLPAALFGQRGTAAVAVMIVPEPAKIALKPYHNCVVCGIDDEAAAIDPPVSMVAAGDTLAKAAARLNYTVEALASANATNANLLVAGTPSSVQPYDSLLSLALQHQTQPLGTQTLDVLWTVSRVELGSLSLNPGAALQIPGWTAARSTVPPGAFGFRAVAVRPAQGSALQKLYSFLGTEIRGLGSSIQRGSMAAGPQATPGAPAANPYYRQILYLAGANPYSCNGQTATLALNYQDVFGNRCLPSSQALELRFKIGYRDPLIGLGQWPGTTVSFDFDSGPQIVFTLGFDTSRYLPAPGQPINAALARARNDLARYIAVAFQIDPPGIAVQVRSSLTGGPADSDGLLNACRKHVHTVRDFLGSLENLKGTTAPVKSRSLAGAAGENGVSVEDLAMTNQDVPNILAAGVILRIPAQYVIKQNETLTGIALRHKVTVQELAANNQDVPNLFATVTIGPTSVSPQPGDTPASIALANNITPSQLFADNGDAPVLRAGTAITTGSTVYKVMPGDTLGSVARGQRIGVPLLATFNREAEVLDAGTGIQLEIPVTPVLPVFKPAATIAFPVSPAIHSTVTPISVSIVIARPQGSVDPLFSDPDQFAAVQSVDSEVRPPVSMGGSSDALASFVSRFEAAFAAFNLTLALGPDQAGTAEASSTKRLYAIRMQDQEPLFRIAGTPRFYAPAPLLNTGWTGTVIIPAGAKVTFSNADVDAWAREFVATLDLLLSAPYAAALHASGNAATYQTLATAKSVIASAMRSSVTPVLAATAATDADLAAAREALFDRVLVQLQEFYKVDAIVQFTVSTAYTGTSARLSGNLRGSPAAPAGRSATLPKPDFTLSNATIDLGQVSSDLTFVFHLASSSQFSDVKLSLAFDPGAVELESAFQGAGLAPGYEAFDRLVFLRSSTGTATDSFASVDIPVPLRAYPAPPSLISQEVVQNLSDRPTLAELKTFRYRFRFNYTTAAQDQLEIGLTTFPAGAASAPADGAPPAGVDTLPEELAQWALFAGSRSAALAGLPGETQSADSLGAAAEFASLAASVAHAWSARTSQPALPTAQLLPEGSEVSGDNPEHLVTVTSLAPDDPLNVIRVQSIQGSLHVTRNGRLAGAAVNPAFLYQVPTVRFAAPLVPHFHEDFPMEIADLPVPPFATAFDPLRREVATLIANLLDANTGTSKDNLPNLRIAVSFEFALAVASDPHAALPVLVTRTPVVLFPRAAFDPPVDFLSEQGLCAAVANGLTEWYTREAPPDSFHVTGTWVFDISLFSNVDESAVQPLLELTNLRVDVISSVPGLTPAGG